MATVVEVAGVEAIEVEAHSRHVVIVEELPIGDGAVRHLPVVEPIN
jgi:hypothetical protein